MKYLNILKFLERSFMYSIDRFDVNFLYLRIEDAQQTSNLIGYIYQKAS